MRWIIDSCTLIYLCKTGLFEIFIEVLKYPVVIDTSVYEEVVIKGIELGYKDALIAKENLTKFRISIIPIDVSKHLKDIGNAGETSCFLLAKESGVIITSDIRAYKKLLKKNIPIIKLEKMFYEKYIQKSISKLQLFDILDGLESVWAITPKQNLELRKKI